MLEQEEMARQEQGLRDMRAQQEVEEARTRADEAAIGGEEGERNLDDEIPDADAMVEAGDDGDTVGDVTFNEESIVGEGSHIVHGDVQQQEDSAVLEEAELTGAARDGEELGIDHERDLDDSVPEAGSYQHTDTELEDSSSSEDNDDTSALNDSFAVQSARRQRQGQQVRQGELIQRQVASSTAGTPASVGRTLQGGLQDRIRAQMGEEGPAEALTRSRGSLNLSSSLLESDFVGSSPVMLRGRGGARRRARGRMS